MVMYPKKWSICCYKMYCIIGSETGTGTVLMTLVGDISVLYLKFIPQTKSYVRVHCWYAFSTKKFSFLSFTFRFEIQEFSFYGICKKKIPPYIIFSAFTTIFFPLLSKGQGLSFLFFGTKYSVFVLYSFMSWPMKSRRSLCPRPLRFIFSVQGQKICGTNCKGSEWA